MPVTVKTKEAKEAAQQTIRDQQFLVILVVVWALMYIGLSYIKQKWPGKANSPAVDLLSLFNGALFSFAAVGLLRVWWDSFHTLTHVTEQAADEATQPTLPA
jgi:RsiW-degrading membrane proteinase PrsW (M82 family)